MEPSEYIRALRIWWWLIAAAVVIGLFAAWITTPASTTEYEATRTLKVEFTDTETISENALNEVGFDVTNGDVPALAAETLGFDDNPALLAEEIETSVDEIVDTVEIVGVDRNPDEADELVDAFAIGLQESVTAEADQGREQAEEQITELNADIAAKEREINGLPEDSPTRSRLDAELQGLLEDRGVAEDAAAALDPVTFELVPPTEPVAVSSGPGRLQRMAIAGLLGLLLGAGLALVCARFDPRIRTKEQAQRAFALPVLAEIPVLARSRRRLHEIVTVSDPESLAGQAYRSLRTSLILKPGRRHMGGGPERKRVHVAPGGRVEPEARRPRSQVVVIASPGMAEGKTTTTANLAAAFGETGRQVLVLECDLRRPTIGQYLGVGEGPGLSDMLAQSGDETDLGTFIRHTSIPNVRVVTAGRPVANPDELLTRVAAVVDAARQHADVVLVDTAPLLATDDASVLVPMADDVVVVCRAGRTPVDAAERASELLTRFGAPAAGVTLVGATILPTARSYYRADHRFWQQAPRRQPRPVPSEPKPNGSGVVHTADQPEPAEAGGSSVTEHPDDH